MTEDPEDGDEFDTSLGLHFSIDFELQNHKLTQQHRNLLRRMINRMIVEATVKMQLLGVPESTVRVYGEERSSVYGRREIKAVPEEGGDG